MEEKDLQQIYGKVSVVDEKKFTHLVKERDILETHEDLIKKDLGTYYGLPINLDCSKDLLLLVIQECQREIEVLKESHNQVVEMLGSARPK